MTDVLIADPDPSSRQALALLLRRTLSTIQIVEAGDVETLIRALADTPPDVLLLDWRLYGSPAPETSQLLEKADPLLKVILLSVDASDAAAAKAAGALFIHKGTAPHELVTTLASLLRNDQ